MNSEGLRVSAVVNLLRSVDFQLLVGLKKKKGITGLCQAANCMCIILYRHSTEWFSSPQWKRVLPSKFIKFKHVWRLQQV